MRRWVPLVLLAGCGSSEPRPLPPSGQEKLRLEARAATELRLACHESMLGSGDGLASPALRFDLAPVPAGAVLRRAVLRLRRGYEDLRRGPRAYAVEVISVNRGLRIREEKDGEILVADHVSDEESAWPALARPHAKYNKQDVVAWLRSWNRSAPARLGAGAEWDEIDVTSLVEEELRGDRSIALLLTTSTIVQVRWKDAPELVVEFDPGGPAPVKAGKIRLRSTPAPAKIYLDGEFLGTTLEGQAVEIAVLSPTVKLRLEKNGYRPWEETLTLPGTGEIHAELVPE